MLIDKREERSKGSRLAHLIGQVYKRPRCLLIFGSDDLMYQGGDTSPSLMGQLHEFGMCICAILS
jgi:hypothetical protein